MAAEDFRPESIASTAFFTGHRILSRDEHAMLPENLFRFLRECFEDDKVMGAERKTDIFPGMGRA